MDASIWVSVATLTWCAHPVLPLAIGCCFAADALDVLGVGADRIVGGAEAALAVGGLGVGFWTSVTHRAVSGRIRGGLLVLLVAVGLTATGLSWSASEQTPGDRVAWVTVRSEEEFQEAFGERPSGKPVVLEFYAHWCAACRAIDRSVFSV